MGAMLFLKYLRNKEKELILIRRVSKPLKFWFEDKIKISIRQKIILKYKSFSGLPYDWLVELTYV